jgi:hypothetical protein
VLVLAAHDCTLKYLLELKGKLTKIENLEYSELKMQSYLKDPDIPVAEARNLYRYRTRSAKYKENMKSSYTDTSLACPVCLLQHDTQQHSPQCPEVKAKIKVNGSYKDIFEEDIPPDISKTLLRINKFREDFF